MRPPTRRRLLFRLHGLIATDAGPEADEVRAQMDSAWAQLDPRQRDELRGLPEQPWSFTRTRALLSRARS